jgi:hypothetical protein
MTRRRPLAVAVIAILAAVAVWLLWPRATAPAHAPVAAGGPAARISSAVVSNPPAGARDEPPIEGESRLADQLNAPSGDVRADLAIINELFATWQSNFPRAGNPVGENTEITAALSGANPLRFAFLPRGHRAVNARGELCDRWGTPLRFHQVSGQQMEMRSAGPDRKFSTDDDAFWPPR